MSWKWVAVLVPVAVGLMIAWLASRALLANPILYLRTDLITLAFLVGLTLSALLVAILAWQHWAEWKRQQSISQLETQTADDRRRFLRRLDHELKNPLTAIRAGLANLAETSNPTDWRDALTSVEAQTLRLGRLTADLRKLTELEIRSLERSAVDLAGLLQEVLALAQEQSEADSRRLTLILPQAPWPLPAISGDWDLLFLAMYNLVDNALKFTESGDTVEMRALEDGATVVIEVADTGPGLAEADIPHVWEELYRGQGVHHVPGSGLGLPLVRAIIERHKGQVTLRSRTGQGTVVTVRLPVE